MIYKIFRFNILLVIFSLSSLVSCCTFKPISKKIKCNEFKRFINENLLIDKDTQAGYINENIRVVTFEDRVFSESLTFISENIKCFEGMKTSEIDKFLRLPLKYSRNEESYFFHTTIETFRCIEYEENCDNLTSMPRLPLVVNIYAKDVVQSAELIVIGGKDYHLNLN